jgi:hypothetical protein
MNLKGLPESRNVADRRGRREPQTFNEQLELALEEPQPERGPPDPTSDLAKKLGVDEPILNRNRG